MPQPRRSNRCDTCRRRKIRCDAVRPRCGQCIKGRRRCVDSRPSYIFSNWTIGSNPLRTEGSTLSCSYNQRQDASERGEMILLPPSGTIKAYPNSTGWMDLWEYFLSAHVPISTSNMLAGCSDCMISLWRSLARLDRSSTLLQHALAAIASVRIGRIESNGTLYKSAYQLYTETVSSLRERLRYEAESAPIDIIATIMILATYEFYEDSTYGFGYISHAQGAGQVIEALGPERFDNGILHELFLNFRELEIAHALIGRRATFLSSPEWSILPWTIRPKRKFDQVQDIAALLAKLLEEAYMLNPSSDKKATLLRLDIINRYWKINDSLLEWYRTLEEANDGHALYVVCHENAPVNGCAIRASSRQSVFPSHFHFRNFEIARCLLLFWSLLCICENGVWWEHMALRGEGSDYKMCASCSWSIGRPCLCYDKQRTLESTDGMRQPLGVASLFVLVDNISCSMEYLLQPEMKGIGAEISVFPLRVAYEAYRFRDDQRRLGWIFDIFSELETRGISWNTSLASMQLPNYRAQSRQRGETSTELL